jgi:Flp pilus assembly pilin Flp
VAIDRHEKKLFGIEPSEPSSGCNAWVGRCNQTALDASSGDGRLLPSTFSGENNRVSQLTREVRNFLADEKGAALLEYAILLLIVAAMSIVTIKAIGGKVSNGFATANTTLP